MQRESRCEACRLVVAFLLLYSMLTRKVKGSRELGIRTSREVKAISESVSDKDTMRVGMVVASLTSCVLCDGSAAMALSLATISLADISTHNHY